MAGSTITGLGSGLDIDGLVKAMVTSQKAPKEAQLQRMSTTTNATLSAVGTLKSTLDTFQTALTSLKSVSSNFSALSAKSSKEDAATVTAGSGAVAGKYNLEVTQLASGSKVATQVVEGGSSASFAGGSLTISLGSASYTVGVDDGATLTDIRNSINSRLSNSAGISANIVTDSSGSRLVLSSETTGEGTDLSVSGSNDSLAQLNVEEGVQQSGNGAGYITQAKDAKFTLDGLAMTSATNTASSAISGLTLRLVGEEKSTITVGPNNDGLKTSVETFVSAYNTLITMTNAMTKVSTGSDGEVTDAGALLGDASVRTLLSSMRNALSTPSADTGDLKVLSQLGISTQKDGTLAIDDSKLSSALNKHYDVVGEFFTGKDGLVSRMDRSVSAFTETGGLLSKRQERLQSTLTDLNEQAETLNRRTEKLETQLYARFNKMDAVLGQMESTRNSIYSMFEAMLAQQRGRR